MMFFGVILVILIFYLMTRQEFPNSNPFYGKRDALEILRERYARGEIDSAEYHVRKEELMR